MWLLRSHQCETMLHLSLELQPLSKNPNEQHKVDVYNYLVPFFSSVISLIQRKLCVVHMRTNIHILGIIWEKKNVFTHSV